MAGKTKDNQFVRPKTLRAKNVRVTAPRNPLVKCIAECWIATLTVRRNLFNMALGAGAALLLIIIGGLLLWIAR